MQHSAVWAHTAQTARTLLYSKEPFGATELSTSIADQALPDQSHRGAGAWRPWASEEKLEERVQHPNLPKSKRKLVKPKALHL